MEEQNIIYRFFNKLVLNFKCNIIIDPKCEILNEIYNEYPNHNKEKIKKEYITVKNAVKKAIDVLHNENLQIDIIQQIIKEMIIENLSLNSDITI